MTAALAPAGPALTAYDEERAITYLRMLGADAEGANWREVALELSNEYKDVTFESQLVDSMAICVHLFSASHCDNAIRSAVVVENVRIS